MSKSNPESSAKYNLVVFFIVSVLGYLASFIFLKQMWIEDNQFLHSAIEISGILILLHTFMHVWNTYSEANCFAQWVGLGALMLALLNLPHIANPADLANISSNIVNSLMDISMKHEILLAYLEIFVWLLLGFYRSGCSVNKWIGLMLTLSTTALFVLVSLMLIDYLPNYYKILTIIKAEHYADYYLALIALAVFAVYRAKLENTFDEREKVLFRYIMITLCYFIAARTCFAVSRESTDPAHLLAHIFKVSYYFFIYHGVYKTTIDYSYKQVSLVKDFCEKLLDAAPHGIITFDREGKIDYANGQCESLFGYDMRGLFGATVEKLLDSMLIYNIDKSELSKKLKEFQEGTVTFCGLPLLTRESASKLIFIALKLRTGIVFVVRDAKKVQAFENMQIQTQTLLDSMDNIVLLLDINSKVVMCNRRFLELTNTKTSDVVGISIMELFNLLQSDIGGSICSNSRDWEMLRGEKWKIKTFNGNIRKLSLNSSPIYDVDNEKIGWIIVGRDVTDYEKEQERIIHFEKMAVIGQMAAGLVHEIKNPLASIKGLCQLMRSWSKPEKTIEYAAVMERAVDDIGEIVTGFLQFSRPAQGDFVKMSVNNLVYSLEMIISANSFKRGIKTQFCYSDTEEPVLINSQQIKNAVLGAVDNALDAMNGALDPKLLISTELDRVNGTMNISIIDNGIGMTEEQLACIGTPFYTTKPKGTGLGISVIKRILDEHKGSLRVESKFGEGTVFTMRLPCTTSD